MMALLITLLICLVFLFSFSAFMFFAALVGTDWFLKYLERQTKSE